MTGVIPKMLSPLLFYGLVKPLSWLPLRVLYGLGSLTAFLLHRLLGFRRSVVRRNLERSFPEKGTDEKRRIERAFYVHLGQLLAESIKFFSIREDEASQMLTCRNPELPRSYFDKGRHVILVGGHLNNWELYAMAAPFHLSHRTYALYKPLSDKFFDRRLRETRERFGLRMLPIRKASAAFRSEDPSATVFAADQSPSNTRNVHWLEFLNQDTPVMKGVERFAKEYDMPVIFGVMHRKERGRYEVSYELITENPGDTEEGWITETHTKTLEREILKKPEHWLWSHRRWKKSRAKGS